MKSLRARLLLAATLVLVVFMLLAGAALEQAFRSSAQQVQRDKMQALVYALLGAADAGEVVSKTTLTEHLYNEDDERDSNVIEVFVRRLRTKLDPDSTLNPITTLRGSGYRWDLPRNA